MKRKTICNVSIILLVCFSLAACTASKQTAQTSGTHVSVPAKSNKGTDTIEVERTYIDGCKYLALNDYENAVKSFSDVLKMDGNNDAAMYQLASIYLRYSKYADATEYAKNAVRLKPNNEEYQLLYGDILNYGAYFQKAADVYEKVLTQDPDNYDVYYRLSYSYEKAGDLNHAIDALLRLEKAAGSDESIYVELQRLYNINNQPEKAVEVMKELVQIDPQNPTYKRFLSEYYEQSGDPVMAEKVFDELLATDTNNTDLQFRKASLMEKSGDKKGYYATMRRALANPYGNIDTKIFYLVLFVDSLGKEEFVSEDSVMEWTRLLVTAHPEEAKAHAMRGDFLYYTDQLKPALESYSKSVALRADVYDVWIKLFYIDADLHLYDSLKTITDRAMEYYPNQPLSYYFNGVALNQQKKYDDAIKVLKRGLPLAVSNINLRSDMFTELGDAYNAVKNYSESDKAYDSSLQLDPNDPYTLNNYAYYLSVRNENLDKAAEMSKRSIELSPNNASLEDTYGWILYQQKKYNDAKTWIEKAMSHGGDKSGTILEHYGDILFKSGDTDKAVEFWQKAKATGEGSEWIDKKISDKKLYE